MDMLTAETNTISVTFDFRFDRDPQQHEKMLEIRRNLAFLFATEKQSAAKIESLKLYPVARAGKSGSEVFYLDLYSEQVSYPRRYVAKFQSVKKTREEQESATKAEHARLCTAVHSVVDEPNDLGMIVCDIARAPKHEEFRGFFLDMHNSDENCAIALRSIFKVVGQHPNEKEKPKRLLEDFQWYVDRPNKPLLRMEALLEASGRIANISSLAKEIIGHYHRIATERSWPVFPYLVHGDLHARNLMVDVEEPTQTELIDFGWVHFGHPAKDFVLMEITIKYMLLPELLGQMGRAAGRDVHISLAMYEWFEDYLCANRLDLPCKNEFNARVSKELKLSEHRLAAITRAYCCLIEIRRAAKTVLEKYCDDFMADIQSSPEQQYFLSQFLVMLGLSGFAEMEPLWTLLGLRSIGDLMWKI